MELMEDNIVDTKQCSKCKEVKPITEFSKNKTRKDGHSYGCKGCMKVYHQTPEYKAKEKTYRESAEGKAYQKAYNKAYYEEHREEILAYRKDYRKTPWYKAWQKAWQKAYYAEHREEEIAYSKAYYVTHKERIAEYRKTPEYKAYNKSYNMKPEVKARAKAYEQSPKCKARAKAYQQTPKRKAYRKSDKYKAVHARADHKRRTAMKELPCTLTAEQWEEIKASQDYKCAMCGKVKPLARDHIFPLSKGGAFTKSNIQGLCRSCNSKKSNKIIDIIEQPKLRQMTAEFGRV